MTEAFNSLFNGKPLIATLPTWVFQLIFGECSEVFLKGQRVTPGVLLQKGFHFQFPTLKEAAADLVKPQ